MDLVPPPPLAIVLGDVPEGVYPRGSAEKLAVVDVARADKGGSDHQDCKNEDPAACSWEGGSRGPEVTGCGIGVVEPPGRQARGKKEEIG